MSKIAKTMFPVLFGVMLATCMNSEFVAQDCSGGGPACINQFALLEIINVLFSNKVIFVTTNTIGGNQISSGISDADTFCNNNIPAGTSGSFKAMLYAVYVSTPDRIATTVANTNTGQTNWVMNASTTYSRPDGTTIATTDSAALFTFPLQNSFATSGNYWTGMDSDWLASDNCGEAGNSWNASSTSSAVWGDATLTSSAAISSESSGSCLSESRSLLCVQQ